MKFMDHKQDIAQYSETSTEGDSSSHGNDARTPSNMGNDKPMEEIVEPGGDKDSEATIPAETVLDSNTAYDWKVAHTGLMQKLKDQFNKEVHIPIMKQPTNVKEKSIAMPHQASSAVREKVIHGVDHNADFPSTYDVDEMDVSNNLTITAVKDSMYHAAIEELEVKPPATKKAQDVLLEDLVPSSTMAPPTPTNIFGISEQLPVSQDANNIHVFNDNNKSTSQENKEEEHPRVTEISITNQLTHTAMKSELVSRTATKMVNLDHTKEFQECMDTYKLAMGYIHLI